MFITLEGSEGIGKNSMIRVPAVAVIIENSQGEILMLLRDDKPDIACPSHWSLAGGKVEDGETPEVAAHRELLEEIGVDLDLTPWKRYDRRHPGAIVDQHIYLGKIDLPLSSLTLGEGQAMRFFHPREVMDLKIAFEFDALLEEYFLHRS
ncbi:MAG TPA: NUDIX domain-containing protein [Anaerolineales bacterium]|nr:NUDIX domain-containing protein [Anaerolineales bacterium]